MNRAELARNSQVKYHAVSNVFKRHDNVFMHFMFALEFSRTFASPNIHVLRFMPSRIHHDCDYGHHLYYYHFHYNDSNKIIIKQINNNNIQQY